MFYHYVFKGIVIIFAERGVFVFHSTQQLILRLWCVYCAPQWSPKDPCFGKMDVVIEDLYGCKSRHGFQGRTALQCLSRAFVHLSTKVDDCIRKDKLLRNKDKSQQPVAVRAFSSRLFSVGRCLSLCASSRAYMRASCARSCVMSFSEHKTFGLKILLEINILIFGSLLLKAIQACLLMDSIFPAQGRGDRESSASGRPPAPFTTRCLAAVKQDACLRACRKGCPKVSLTCHDRDDGGGHPDILPVLW